MHYQSYLPGPSRVDSDANHRSIREQPACKHSQHDWNGFLEKYPRSPSPITVQPKCRRSRHVVQGSEIYPDTRGLTRSIVAITSPSPAALGPLEVISRGQEIHRLSGFGAGLALLALAYLPALGPLNVLAVSLTPVAALALVVEGCRTCWMEVGGAGTGPAYASPASRGVATG